jgi:DNA processing protein
VKRFLVNDARVTSLVSRLSDSATEAEIEGVFARATFSLITEPGDRFAGGLMASLSPEVLLDLLLKRASTSEVLTKLKESDGNHELPSRISDFGSAYSDALQRWTPRLKLVDVIAALDLADRHKATILTPLSKRWPNQLDDLQESSPHCLWVKASKPEVFDFRNSLSVVGSRTATGYGEWVTSEIVADSSSRNLPIVSGGAYGIDAIAHRAAIANELVTVAFMAGGIDRLYPSGNAALFAKMLERGAVVAEQAPGASPTKWRFLQRNRLIAAMSSATIVVEAGQRSGALNTVTHALELGRPVGVVPGAITSQASAGCNRLISEGLVSSICAPSEAADLALGKAGWFQPELAGLGAYETRALDAMNSKSLAPADIASRAGLTSRETEIALGQLALQGFVKQTDRGWLKLPLDNGQRDETGGE